MYIVCVCVCVCCVRGTRHCDICLTEKYVIVWEDQEHIKQEN